MSNIAYQPSELFSADACFDFIAGYGWEIDSAIVQDSSIRRYFRLKKSNETAILMETLPDGSEDATAGHSITDFIRIGEWLNEIGLNAPNILARDESQGYLILEDFGDTSFKTAIEQGADKATLYSCAKDVLDNIAAQNCPLELPQYYDSHVHKFHTRVVNWYVPLVRKQKNEAGLEEAYLEAWKEVKENVPCPPQTFLHIDYHAQNLMWLPENNGLQRCGILDFQGAMIGPAPYDLANLLEDARADVPNDIRQSILSQYDEQFRAQYRILATQFHCRVIGQFIKIAINGNPSYLQCIPRLERYLHEALQNPTLKPLQSFFKELGIDFSAPAPLEKIATLQSFLDERAQ